MPSRRLFQPGSTEVSSFGCGISCIVLFSASCWHNLTYRLQSLVWGSCLPVYFHSSVERSWAQERLFWTWNPITSPPSRKGVKANSRKQTPWGLLNRASVVSQPRGTREDSEQEAGWRPGRDTCLGPASLILHRVALLWGVEFRNSDIPVPNASVCKLKAFRPKRRLSDSGLLLDPKPISVL